MGEFVGDESFPGAFAGGVVGSEAGEALGFEWDFEFVFGDDYALAAEWVGAEEFFVGI